MEDIAVQGSRRFSLGRTGILVLVTIPFLYPFLFLIGTALKPLAAFDHNSISWPSHPTWQNIIFGWTSGGLGAGMLHSVIAVSIGAVVTLVISALGAFWFYRRTSNASRILRVLLISTMAFPPPVFIIPLYVMLSSWNLTDNLIILGLVYAGWNSSFGLYLMYAYYKDAIPLEVLEAAQIDGASIWQTFSRIVMPLSVPILATLAALTFVWSWGDLLISVVLVENPALRTLVVSAALLTNRYNTDIPANAAAALIALVPMLLVFLIAQRYLMKGIVRSIDK